MAQLVRVLQNQKRITDTLGRDVLGPLPRRIKPNRPTWNREGAVGCSKGSGRIQRSYAGIGRDAIIKFRVVVPI